MELTFDQIVEITRGAVEVRRDRNAIVFHKCTDKQTAVWYEFRRELGDRSLTTTGIRLDFHTDSRSFSFEAVRGKKFDVLIDGVLAHHIHRDCPMTFSCDLPEGDTRVTVIFPSHHIGQLASVSIDDGAYIKPHEYSRKILFIGDSISQGWDAKLDSLSFAWRTALHYNADCVMNAIGGAIFLPEANDSIPFEPDTVIVSLGTNDMAARKSIDELGSNADGVFSFLAKEYPDARLVAITPIWRADEDKPRKTGTLEDIRRRIAEIASGYGFEIIEGSPLVPHVPELFADGYLHPNDIGYEYYANALIAALDAAEERK